MMSKLILPLLAVLLSSSVCADPGTQGHWQEPTTGLSFVRIEKGCFQMGTDIKASDPDELLTLESLGVKTQGQDDEVPHHEACLGSYWIGKNEVTADAWEKVMGGPTSSSPRSPVSAVTWSQAREFAARLSRLAGATFRLPTEAEWEFACRAGAKAPETVPINRELIGKAWHSRQEARRYQPQAVGQLEANAFGLHDMLGNVWEWVEDSYDASAYSRHALHDPLVVNDRPQKVMRGGSFRTEPRQTRCAVRGHLAGDKTMDSIGFRLVRIVKE